MGVLMARSKRAPTSQGKYLWLLAGLAVSVFFHGLYDTLLTVDNTWVNRLSYLQVVLMGVLAWRLMRLRPVPSAGEQA